MPVPVEVLQPVSVPSGELPVKTAPIAEQPDVGVECSPFSEQPEAELPPIVQQTEAAGELPPIAGQLQATVEPPLVSERLKATKEPPKDHSVSINLGRRSIPPTPSGLRSTPTENHHEGVDIKGKRQERIESPYVEINLDNLGNDERAVQLILPDQRLLVSAENDVTSQYNVELNSDTRKVECKAKIRNDHLELREERLGLSRPLERFRVTFPEAIHRKYRYHHENDALFVFTAIGANRGRLIYNISNLPKRPVWVLLREGYELVSEPDIEEQQWVWEQYRPYRVDLRQIDALAIVDKRSGERLSIPCRPTFKITGDRLIQDDFLQESPLVSGNTLIVEAPYQSEQGWNVWIHNKVVGEVLASEKWTGAEPLQVEIWSVLPCNFGEFQVDIWANDADNPEATLFFRWVPSLELNYPRELLIPSATEGHATSVIVLAMEKDGNWELRNESGQCPEPHSENKWELVIPAEKDMVHLSLQKKGEMLPPVDIQVTLPRLKWKTTKQENWQSTLQLIDRKQLLAGEPFDVTVCTNDHRYKYNICASIDANGKQLQQGRFDFKGGYYVLGLNQFYDTIQKHKTDKLALRIEIAKRGEAESLRALELLCFASERSEVPLPDILKNSTSDIRRVLRRIRTAYPTMKWACDDILQFHTPESASEPQARDEFIVHSMALLKYVIDTIGITKVKGHKLWSRRLKRRWGKRIETIQNRYAELFGAAYKKFRRR